MRAQQRGGIIAAHCDSLQKLATEKQICIAIRPVNKAATALIEAGFGTKDMAIKGKSSNIPPLSGLVPRDQLLGKKSSKPEEAGKLAAKNEESIRKQTATAVRLNLPAEHLRTMTGLTVEGTWLNEKPPDGSPRSGVMRGTDPATGREHAFVGEWQADGTVGIFLSREENGRLVKGDPVEVMGNRSGKAVTADYDLAFIAPRMKDFGREHTLPVKVTSLEEAASIRRGGVSGGELSDDDKDDYFSRAAGSFVTDDYEKSAIFPDEQEAPRKSLGNISQYTRELIPALNNACGRSEPGLELFHHGDDAGNPWTVEDDNYPMTIILPDEASLPGDMDRIVTIEDHDQLRELYQTLKDASFLPPANFGWGEDIARVRSSSFNRAKDDLEVLMQQRLSPKAELSVGRLERSQSAPARLSGTGGDSAGRDQALQQQVEEGMDLRYGNLRA